MEQLQRHTRHDRGARPRHPGSGAVIFMSAAILLTMTHLTAAYAGQKQLKFVWEYPDPPADLAGFYLYASTIQGTYQKPLMTINYDPIEQDYHAETILESPDGQIQTWYFILTAFDKHGNESTPSNEVSAIVDFEKPPAPLTLTVDVIPIPTE